MLKISEFVNLKIKYGSSQNDTYYYLRQNIKNTISKFLTTPLLFNTQ